MSNFLAIATVTAALQQLLQTPVHTAVSGANVGFSRPDSSGSGGPGVNVYLYQVTPNAAYRNADLPTRRADGTLLQKPQAALDLHYLFTFQGKDDLLEPQRMLGVVTSTLNDQPLLSAQNIQAAIASKTYLSSSDLANQVESVRFTPTALTLEEFSKLWSAFFQVEYSLSVAYQASVVLLESDRTPQEALPVQSRNVYVAPFRSPTITRIISQAGAGQPILASSTLVIEGRNLMGAVTLVRIGNVTVTPATVTDKAIVMPVPANAPAGLLGVQVIQSTMMGTPPLPHSGVQSNVAALVLQPVITSQNATANQVSITVSPTVQVGQRATLLLNEATLPPPVTPAAYSFSLPPLSAATAALNFTTSGVQGGGTVYFVRVTVDGAESPVDFDPNSSTFGPTVTVP